MKNLWVLVQSDGTLVYDDNAYDCISSSCGGWVSFLLSAEFLAFHIINVF